MTTLAASALPPESRPLTEAERRRLRADQRECLATTLWVAPVAFLAGSPIALAVGGFLGLRLGVGPLVPYPLLLLALESLAVGHYLLRAWRLRQGLAGGQVVPLPGVVQRTWAGARVNSGTRSLPVPGAPHAGPGTAWVLPATKVVVTWEPRP